MSMTFHVFHTYPGNLNITNYKLQDQEPPNITCRRRAARIINDLGKEKRNKLMMNHQ
jgi:hypothetical protein